MYLGLDMGTSGMRGLLVDAQGNVRGEASSDLSTQHPHPGWSEQDPDSWISACEDIVQQLKRSNPAEIADLRGIGLSGHMHGATLVDRDDAVIRPCILWNDTRSAAEAAALDSLPAMREISGNIVFPGFTAPKLAWMETHEPEAFARIAKVLLPKDYLRLYLTGDHVGDMSDSAGTSWLDVGARAWSAQALDITGMRADQMPDLVEGSAPSGQLRPALAKVWGIKGSVVVAGGAGDNAAAACGVGCFAEGDGFVSLGTSGVLLAARDRYAPNPASAVHSFCHAVPARWYQMGVILAATDCLNWLGRTVGQSPGDLARALPDAATAPSPLIFLPYLSGERTPHNDAAIRGAFIGLDVSHDTVDLTRAVMEGVAFALRDSLEALRTTGADLSRLLAVGGGTRSPFWLSSLANVLNLPLDLPGGGEFGAALGAARLAICADTGAAPEEIMTRPEIARTIEPVAGGSDGYEAAYQRYRALYPALTSGLAG